jgi:hypothetical protein
MMAVEIRFTQAARKHRIGRASVRYVMATTTPAAVTTGQGNPGWRYVGPDERGRELEIIAAGSAASRARTRTCWLSTSCPQAFGEVVPMPEPQPPRITPDTPIGPDVDLDRDDVRLADGTRLTQEVADRIVAQARRGGRPSLSGEAAVSPQIAFRVSPAVRDKAAAAAAAEHKTISDLAREALERYLAERPGA